ncbi:S-adenosyl-L-methionine-dependent methyltransferase [Calocera viscosa TUFC12733]|uniref:S-adenosyl-L-methionine-dependent methyltransferase n=1 Tax=Calocera viscosa (strain TUFC12733) TaxID=1330018 RepID=A0A167HII7_CALVF|nr:S-adenosyl-L-methionine-dependent methyltransferase [Calocera viscosa TUFC12733]
MANMDLEEAKKAENYLLKNEGKELTRLDDQHNGFKTYIGSNYVAPLSTIPRGPKKILELGAGSGIWAAEMAEEFPGAQVIAADKAPIKGEMPKNVTTTVVDLSKSDWPWTKGEFDIVHGRFLFIHLSNAPEVLKRVFELVAPGGYALLEDSSHHIFSSSPETDPVLPAVKTFHDTGAHLQAQRGLDTSIGEKYEGYLKESGLFEEVGVTKIDVPMLPWTDDAKLNDLGAAVKHSFVVAFYGALPMIPEQMRAGFKSMTDNWKAGVDEEGHKFFVPYYFAWGRKKSA